MSKKNKQEQEVSVEQEVTLEQEQTVEPEVQPEPSTESVEDKSISQLADEVMKGKYGSGRERMLLLGDKYAAVQIEVTRRIRSK